MDIARPSQTHAKRRKHLLLGGITVVVLAAITFGLGQLKPAAPSVDRSLVWIGTVQRGPMVREVRGLGTLVPEHIRWIAARTAARVDEIVLRPGAVVTPDSIILKLDNPDVLQAAETAQSSLRAAEAQLVSLGVQLKRDLLSAEASAAGAKAAFEESKLRAQVNEELFARGLVTKLDRQLSQVSAEETATRHRIEQQRVQFAEESIQPQLAVQEAEVDRLRAQARLRQAEAEALNVRAGMAGVLSALPVEVGAQIQPGTNLARVADPTALKAEIRIAETQARDIAIGQKAVIDTRNGLIAGRVGRIDPAVQHGTVLVDVTLEEALPRGARPDLSVDGTIELERLENVLFVGRPAFAQEQSTTGLFRLDATGNFAERAPVELGRTSVNTVEIRRGLQPGDQVILSDMSPWDEHDRVKLN